MITCRLDFNLMSFKFEKLIVWQKAVDGEVAGCLYLAQKRSLIEQPVFSEIYAQCEEILVMINGLKNSLK